MHNKKIMTTSLRNRLAFLYRIAIATIAVLAVVQATTQAAEPLRWKLKAGEKYDFTVKQQSEIAMSVMDQDIEMSMEVVIDAPWEVTDVDDEGVMTVASRFQRIQMNMQSPFFAFDYDSDSEEKPTGPEAMFTDAFGTLVGVEFVSQISPRGEFVDVQFDEGAFDKMKGMPGMEQMAGMFSPDGMKQLIGQGLAVFPENAPTVGETWKTSTETPNPAFGKQKVEMTYEFGGQEEIDGRTLAKVNMAMELDFIVDEAQNSLVADIALDDQDSTGTMFFDTQAGRLSHSVFTQSMQMTIEAVGQFMEQDVDTTVNITLTPAKPASDAASDSSSESETNP